MQNQHDSSHFSFTRKGQFTSLSIEKKMSDNILLIKCNFNFPCSYCHAETVILANKLNFDR